MINNKDIPSKVEAKDKGDLSISRKILMVDDEPNVLRGYKRQLHKDYAIEIATSGDEALEFLASEGPFSVVVSDQKMPGMDGVTFLTKVKSQYPEIVRLMLTGQADMEETIAAVNEGNIFRFLSKPCTPKSLMTALDSALHQYSLVVAEKELLDKTLRGSVQVLVEVLSLANPYAFGRSSRVSKFVKQMAININYAYPWELEMATLLCNLGMITVPEKILSKVFMRRTLTDDEMSVFLSHPNEGYRLLKDIPRMEDIATLVGDQAKKFDRTEVELTPPGKAQEILFGRHLLNLALEFDHLVVTEQKTEAMAITQMLGNSKKGEYNPKAIEALKDVIFPPKFPVDVFSVEELQLFMVTAEAIIDKEGKEIVPEGQIINKSYKQKLSNLEGSIRFKFPLKMWVEEEGV